MKLEWTKSKDGDGIESGLWSIRKVKDSFQLKIRWNHLFFFKSEESCKRVANCINSEIEGEKNDE